MCISWLLLIIIPHSFNPASSLSNRTALKKKKLQSHWNISRLHFNTCKGCKPSVPEDLQAISVYRSTISGHRILCDFNHLIIKNSTNITLPYVRPYYAGHISWTPLNVSMYSVINTTKPAGTPIESSTTEFDFPRHCKSWHICIRFSLPTDTTQRWQKRTTIYSTSPNIRRDFLLFW